MEHNEILGMDAALKYINQTLVDKLGDITLQARLLLSVLYIVSNFHTKHKRVWKKILLDWCFQVFLVCFWWWDFSYQPFLGATCTKNNLAFLGYPGDPQARDWARGPGGGRHLQNYAGNEWSATDELFYKFGTGSDIKGWCDEKLSWSSYKW